MLVSVRPRSLDSCWLVGVSLIPCLPKRTPVQTHPQGSGRSSVELQRERRVLEQAIQSVAKQARNAYDLIDALEAAGLDPGDEPMVAAKELRAELLRVK